MEIPHKVQIKSDVFYYVVYVDKFDDPDQYGYCIDAKPPHEPGARTIMILNSLSKKEKLETFCHELLHAIEFEFKIKIPHQLIYKLQMPLAQLFLQNPALVLGQLSKAAARRKRKPRQKRAARKKTPSRSRASTA